MTIATERTITLLTTAILPEGTKNFDVPDTSSSLDYEQRAIIENYKAAFGCQAATSTFRVALNKLGEQVVYGPSVVSKGGNLVIKWGRESFPLPAGCTFVGTSSIEVEFDGDEYRLQVRIFPIRDEKDAKTATQKAWFTCKPDERASFLLKAFNKKTLHELVAQDFKPVLKIAEVPGTHKVVSYYMGSFDKYVLELADGRLVRANNSLTSKLEAYDALGVEVSEEKPARLTVGEALERKTPTGYSIYPTELVGYHNVDLPVFDFNQAA